MLIAHDERVLNTSRRIFQEFVVRMHFGCHSRIIERRFPPRPLFPPTGGGEYAINRGVLGGLSFYGRILCASVTNTWTKSICDRNLSVGALVDVIEQWHRGDCVTRTPIAYLCASSWMAAILPPRLLTGFLPHASPQPLLWIHIWGRICLGWSVWILSFVYPR